MLREMWGSGSCSGSCYISFLDYFLFTSKKQNIVDFNMDVGLGFSTRVKVGFQYEVKGRGRGQVSRSD